MDSNGPIKYLNNNNKKQGSQVEETTLTTTTTTTTTNGSSCQIEHLVVDGLFEEESQERKSSISFDKIKQISLTYSLQSDEDDVDLLPTNVANNSSLETSNLNGTNVNEQQPQVLKVNESGKEHEDDKLVTKVNERRDSHGSFSLSPVGDELHIDSPRKISVIEVKEGKRQLPIWASSIKVEAENENNNTGTGNSSIVNLCSTNIGINGTDANNNNNNKREVKNRTEMPSRTLTNDQNGPSEVDLPVRPPFQSPYLETNPFAATYKAAAAAETQAGDHKQQSATRRRRRRERPNKSFMNQRADYNDQHTAAIYRNQRQSPVPGGLAVSQGEIYFRPTQSGYQLSRKQRIVASGYAAAAAGGVNVATTTTADGLVATTGNSETPATSGDDNYSLGRKLLPDGQVVKVANLRAKPQVEYEALESDGGGAQVVAVRRPKVGPTLRRQQQQQQQKGNSISLVLYNETDTNIIIDHQTGALLDTNQEAGTPVGSDGDVDEVMEDDDYEEDDDEDEDEDEEDDDELDEEDLVDDEEETFYSDADLYWTTTTTTSPNKATFSSSLTKTSNVDLAAGNLRHQGEAAAAADYLSGGGGNGEEDENDEEMQLIVRQQQTSNANDTAPMRSIGSSSIGHQMVHNGATDTVRDLNIINRPNRQAPVLPPRRVACQTAARVRVADVATGSSSSIATPLLAPTLSAGGHQQQHQHHQRPLESRQQLDAVNHRGNRLAKRLASERRATNAVADQLKASSMSQSFYRAAAAAARSPSSSSPPVNTNQPPPEQWLLSANNNNNQYAATNAINNQRQQPQIYTHDHHDELDEQSLNDRPFQRSNKSSSVTSPLIGFREPTGSADRAHQQRQLSQGRRMGSSTAQQQQQQQQQQRSLTARTTTTKTMMRPLSVNQSQVKYHQRRQLQRRCSDQMTELNKVSYNTREQQQQQPLRFSTYNDQMNSEENEHQKFTSSLSATAAAFRQRPTNDRQSTVTSVARNELWSDLYDDEREFMATTMQQQQQQHQRSLLATQRNYLVDDDYEQRIANLYATPVRRARANLLEEQHLQQQQQQQRNNNPIYQRTSRLTCDEGRRLNIFISSPQRRPPKRRSQAQPLQQQWSWQKPLIWTNSSPSTGSRQDSCYVSNGQPNSIAAAAAAAGTAARLSQPPANIIDFQQHQASPASSIGSQSCCWSNYGSYTRASDTDQKLQVQVQVAAAAQQQQQHSNQHEADLPGGQGRSSLGVKTVSSSSGIAVESTTTTAQLIEAAKPQQSATATTTESANTTDATAAKEPNTCKSSVVAAAAAAKPSPPKKPIKLRNLLNGEQAMDNLHFKYQQNNKSHGCSEMRCLGSMMNAKPVEYKVRSISETLEHAKDFINNFYASIKRLDSPAHKTRLREIEEQLNSTETYYLKETELIYGAKLAWRNASRCIGRIQWSKLQVFDARFTTTANEMFEAVCNHIKYATNKGSLRSAITILPQRVKSTKNDWRIWNSQLIGYAGYRNKETGQVIGDPANTDFTEVCQKLGWKGKGTRFDVLPIVLSANGGPPQLFPLPEELVLRVQIRHPKFKCFEELGLQWYALPAVANMMLDVGGLQFTAAPFSGWYMVTEIGARDLGDTNRYNVLEQVAQKMGLNTTSNMSLWKDQALVELNIAVLDSFQQAGVTIVDHHTATDTFMTHLANEQRLRGGCPADWVWLVPPMSGSATQVFHQEMVNYHLLPNYEYMDPVWKNFDWNNWEKLEQEKRDGLNKKRASLIAAAAANETQVSVGSPASRLINAAANVNGELTPRKLRFKEIARAVKFTSKLFGKALSRRIKATILYATETGKSERFANKLAQTFSCVFNVHLMSMSDYDMTFLEHEALLLIVTSTFGNGDPPESGELFAKHIAAVKLTGDTSPDLDSINSVSTNPFFQMLSEDHKDGLSDEKSESDENGFLKVQQHTKQEQATHIRPLSNVRFGVFALGSTAYPHFCAYGRYVDQTLGELGAERILKCTCGDELSGQEKAFNEWSNEVFRTACDVFCLTDTIGPIEERPEMRWSPQDVRFVPVELIADASNNCNSPGTGNGATSSPTTVGHITYGSQHMLRQSSMISTVNNPNEVLGSKKVVVRNLMNITNKKIIAFNVKGRTDLHEFNPIDNLQTFSIELDSDRVFMADKEGIIIGNSISSSPVRNQAINTAAAAVATRQHQVTPVGSAVTFKPGDHIAIYPVNKLEMVEQILDRMKSDLNRSDKESCSETKENTTTNTTTVTGGSKFDFDQVYSILVKREKMDLTPAPPMATSASVSTPQSGSGNAREEESWIPHDRLPVTSFREALTRYMDITSPPNQEFLLILSHQTSDLDERKRLQQMARNFTLYEEWKNKTVPTLLSVLQEFKTISFEPALITQIPLMKPRFYSVSGTSIVLTVGVVRFKTLSGELREGLCSNYLNTVDIDPQTWIYGYVRSAPAFHMPQDKSIPIILISAGTGMAPFRSFWQKRYEDMQRQQNQNGTIGQQQQQQKQKFGRIEMYFGCRNSDYILYKDELDEMYEKGVLSSINIAFSRPRDCDVRLDEVSKSGELGQQQIAPPPLPNPPPPTSPSKRYMSKVATIRQARKKMYVQDKLLEDSDDIYKLIMLDGAHIYVCGDVAMADGVYKTLASIFNSSLKANKFSDNCDPSSSDNAITSGLSGIGCGGGGSGSGLSAGIGNGLAKSSDDGESILMNLRNLNRYHEDIFGAKQMS